ARNGEHPRVLRCQSEPAARAGVAAPLLRPNRGRLSTRPAACLVGSALPRGEARDVAGGVSSGASRRAARGGRGGRPGPRGAVDRARRADRRDARLHGTGGEPGPRRQGRDPRRLRPGAHERRAGEERRAEARGVGVRAGGHGKDVPPPPPPHLPYLNDLLRYEEAMMIAEAGPRVWRDSAHERAAGSREPSAPKRVEGTALLDLAYDLPAV